LQLEKKKTFYSSETTISVSLGAFEPVMKWSWRNYTIFVGYNSNSKHELHMDKWKTSFPWLLLS